MTTIGEMFPPGGMPAKDPKPVASAQQQLLARISRSTAEIYDSVHLGWRGLDRREAAWVEFNSAMDALADLLGAQ